MAPLICFVLNSFENHENNGFIHIGHASVSLIWDNLSCRNYLKLTIGKQNSIVVALLCCWFQYKVPADIMVRRITNIFILSWLTDTIGHYSSFRKMCWTAVTAVIQIIILYTNNLFVFVNIILDLSNYFFIFLCDCLL